MLPEPETQCWVGISETLKFTLGKPDLRVFVTLNLIQGLDLRRSKILNQVRDDRLAKPCRFRDFHSGSSLHIHYPYACLRCSNPETSAEVAYAKLARALEPERNPRVISPPRIDNLL